MIDRYELAVATGTTEYYYEELRKEAQAQAVLTLEQVAQWLDVSTRTITRLVDRGELVGFHVGRALRFRRDDVLLYIDEKCIQKKSPLERVRFEAQKHPELVAAMIEMLSQALEEKA